MEEFTLQNLLDQKAAHVASLWQEARRLAVIFRRMGALQVYVFGSLARGEADAASDLDLAVIAGTDAPYPERSLPFYRALGSCAVPVDIVVITPEEVQASPKSILWSEIIEEGLEV
ncbi:MAG: nucleotidyltransferase domain-containing protein [Thermaerobacter sp.]|nr:nucleotidyltransferase domain-containing protein [Thermaerobacter sp.]